MIKVNKNSDLETSVLDNTNTNNTTFLHKVQLHHLLVTVVSHCFVCVHIQFQLFRK